MKEKLLAELEKEVAACRNCRLHETRLNPVFGEGNPSAGLLFVGEGPGADEDRIGRPFVGKSGQLMDRIFEACGWNRRDHLYIANIVKCHPPGNRAPDREERAFCLPYLYRQIEIIKPRIIVLLGAVALQSLVDPSYRITKVRGQWLERHGAFIMPTYHPAALLRNPSLKREAWEDYKMVIDKYRELVDANHFSPHH